MNKFQTLQNIPNFAFLMDIISCVGFQNYSIEEHFGVYCFKAKFEQKKKKIQNFSHKNNLFVGEYINNV